MDWEPFREFLSSLQLLPAGINTFISAAKSELFFPMKPVVLYAEDDSNDVLMCQRAFKSSGLSIDFRFVGDGACAISWLLGHGHYGNRVAFPLPSLVITDSKMPVKGGLDVLRFMRGHAEFKDIPVVLYYGSHFMQDLGIFQKLGVAACIEKKLGCDELTQTVGELLRRQQPRWRSTLMVGAATRTFPGSHIATV